MQGPFPAGTHRVNSPHTTWEECLARGATYSVIKPFKDADWHTHQPGERWKFLASQFSPYDDELLIAVALEDSSEWRIRLLWKPEEQQAVIESFAGFVSKS